MLYSWCSKYLVQIDEIDQYFEGGMEDMAAWTRLAWDTTLWMAAYGPENCHIEHNPLNLHCPKGTLPIFNRIQ